MLTRVCVVMWGQTTTDDWPPGREESVVECKENQARERMFEINVNTKLRIHVQTKEMHPKKSPGGHDNTVLAFNETTLFNQSAGAKGHMKVMFSLAR